ncbi:APH(3'') family aminoglycoside O-phosphotransferase [Prauserella cavernicola]|uniref:APH(3'') family aminoglycoside O-phosphotransferase n=1 Tax=Prauserella cavernicola TaxID=2800127 RepID=A0A934V6P0_9PSEU|nr:APH(3'') family aminoglycoside O-phosphotransferase [Prauserella cavernicola]MBK1787737.1 APH(3'') family aminoglycoside O-phosphotransferase [Prauserella cavernicola]
MLEPPGSWEPVRGGESGATVLRSADGTTYAKCVSSRQHGQLSQERDRVAWLSGTGIAGPRVLDWDTGPDGAYLITTAVPGVPADTVPAADLARAWPSIADIVRALHALPAPDCPFDRDLTRMLAMAADVVARDAVEPAFLPVDQQGTPPAELLARLEPQRDRRLADERADTVVCHGDLCLPNILLDPDTLDVTGVIDLGRLGRADRHADLALLFATARETWPEDRADVEQHRFAAHYDGVPDPGRLRFYLHLDPLTWG